MSRTVYITQDYSGDEEKPSTRLDSLLDDDETEAADVSILNAMVQATEKKGQTATRKGQAKEKKARRGIYEGFEYGFSYNQHTEEETKEEIEKCLQAPKRAY